MNTRELIQALHTRARHLDRSYIGTHLQQQVSQYLAETRTEEQIAADEAADAEVQS